MDGRKGLPVVGVGVCEDDGGGFGDSGEGSLGGRRFVRNCKSHRSE